MRYQSLIPPNAKRVFKGVIFEVWQWEQKVYDGSIKTFERLKRPDTAQIIPIVGDKILIQIQEQPHRPEPFLSLPGGRCDEGEEPLAAARRELIEETGYTSNDWTFLQDYSPGSLIIWTIYTFIARNCAKTEEIHLDPGEKIRTRLITFDEFLEIISDPSFRGRELLHGFILPARYDPKEREKLRTLLFS